MSKSSSTKILSDLLKLWPKLTEEEAETRLQKTLEEGEKPTPLPKNPVTRYEDNENGRIFYIDGYSISTKRAYPVM